MQSNFCSSIQHQKPNIVTVESGKVDQNVCVCVWGGHNGRKSLILAPQEIPDISGYQWGFGRRFVKAYNTENPVTNQKIL